MVFSLTGCRVRDETRVSLFLTRGLGGGLDSFSPAVLVVRERSLVRFRLGSRLASTNEREKRNQTIAPRRARWGSRAKLVPLSSKSIVSPIARAAAFWAPLRHIQREAGTSTPRPWGRHAILVQVLQNSFVARPLATALRLGFASGYPRVRSALPRARGEAGRARPLAVTSLRSCARPSVCAASLRFASAHRVGGCAYKLPRSVR